MRRKLRLRSSSEFSKVYIEGRSTGNKYLVLYYLYQQDSVEPTKVGFSINKKVGSAVTRNKLKRRLRAIFLDNINEIKPGHLLIVVVKRQANELNFQLLRESALSLVKKSGILGKSDAPDNRDN